MKWVTRERVKVDRVACPWLIRKFIDPQAEFLFVPKDKVLAVADHEGAIPFDVLGVESLPMKAIWKGFSHPGITWKGTVAFNVENFMSLMARGVMTDSSNQPGEDSYAILSKEYLNLSAKFGYHFANLDAFLSDLPDQNYISLQFAGGAGTYYGKTLRLNFLGNVLFMLGFKINVTGDLLEASLSGLDRASMENSLDQVGRLLASSRLLDMGIANEAEMKRMIEGFLPATTIFSIRPRKSAFPAFIPTRAIGGGWRRTAAPSCCKTALITAAASPVAWPTLWAR